jgi:hypothetical protein
MTLTFVCSICGEPSASICVYCTKDACPNHLCERCGRCSDCCECDIRLEEHTEAPEPVWASESADDVHLPPAPAEEAAEAEAAAAQADDAELRETDASEQEMPSSESDILSTPLPPAREPNENEPGPQDGPQ